MLLTDPFSGMTVINFELLINKQYKMYVVKNRNFTLLGAGLLGFALLIAHASGETFKWTDSAGKVHYTDTPPPDDVALEEIDVGECKSEQCRLDLSQDQKEAELRLQKILKWNTERATERKERQDQQRQAEIERKKAPRTTITSGY